MDGMGYWLAGWTNIPYIKRTFFFLFSLMICCKKGVQDPHESEQPLAFRHEREQYPEIDEWVCQLVFQFESRVVGVNLSRPDKWGGGGGPISPVPDFYRESPISNVFFRKKKKK